MKMKKTIELNKSGRTVELEIDGDNPYISRHKSMITYIHIDKLNKTELKYIIKKYKSRKDFYFNEFSADNSNLYSDEVESICTKMSISDEQQFIEDVIEFLDDIDHIIYTVNKKQNNLDEVIDRIKEEYKKDK